LVSNHLIILISLTAVTLFAWGILLYQHNVMIREPILSTIWRVDNQVWQLADFLTAYLMWAVMMVAMMLPSMVSMMIALNHVYKHKQISHLIYQYGFVLAYLSIWLIFGLLLTLLQWQCHRLGWLTQQMMLSHNLLVALTFIGVGGYQFTLLKNSCLTHCRTPLSFLLNHWRDGRQGAFYMGGIHGFHCLGCCWAQMLLMFAVGIMNITAMVIMTLVILLEKALPNNETVIHRLTGGGLIGWGVILLFS